MKNIRAWAENITKEIYLEYKDKYPFWKHGIKVFYSSVVVKPPLMIISYQPGGTEKNFAEEEKTLFEKGDFQLQSFNSYTETSHPMSRKIQNFFNFTGGFELLKTSVVFPLIFFRSPSVTEWRKIPRLTRIKMEEFSFLKVKEIVNTLQPQRILVLGIETYEQLKDILPPIKKELVLHRRQSNGERMVITSQAGEYKLFAVIHPSGARISTVDWDIIRELFKKEIAL